jgi:hypothetical protein
MSGRDRESRFERVKAAFEADGFEILPVADPEEPGAELPYLRRRESIACRARHKTAVNTVTGEPKAAYYVEGSNYLMGYFMGLLAEGPVSAMTNEYCDDVIADFFDLDALIGKKSSLVEKAKDLIVDIIYRHSQAMIRDVPYEYVEELKGMLDGCAAAKADTAVTWERLWALNYGIDCLIAHLYTGRFFEEAGISAKGLRVPIGCNAFCLSGSAAADGARFFGRDFMFPTAGVFQDVACIVIHRPDRLEGEERRPFASQTAPGIIGSVVAMNDLGLGAGIEMLPSSYCDPERPGFNALALTRDIVQYCATAEEAARRVTETQRGVSWLYSVADASGASCVIEAGASPRPGETVSPGASTPEYYRKRLPDAAYLERMRAKHGYAAPDRGAFVRWAGFHYPQDFVEDFNKPLFEAYARKFPDRLLEKLGGIALCIAKAFGGAYGGFGEFSAALRQAARRKADWSRCDSGERGRYCRAKDDQNLPGPYYFAPQREERPDLIVAANAFISPEMRLGCMNDWIAMLAGASLADFQWRYDTLNASILEAIDSSIGGVGAEAAWKLIDFLDPARADGEHKDYYNPGGRKDPRRIEVGGSVSLLELTGASMRSLWGYYGDESVTIHLSRYL